MVDDSKSQRTFSNQLDVGMQVSSLPTHALRFPDIHFSTVYSNYARDREVVDEQQDKMIVRMILEDYSEISVAAPQLHALLKKLGSQERAPQVRIEDGRVKVLKKDSWLHLLHDALCKIPDIYSNEICGSEYMETAYEVFRSHGVEKNGHPISIKLLGPLRFPDVGRAMNHLLSDMFPALTSKEFTSRLHSREAAARHQYNRCSKYVDLLLARYQKMHLVQFELRFPEDRRDEDDIYKCRKWFFDRFRKGRLSSALVGHIWHLEFDPRRGYFFSVMAFLKPSTDLPHL